MKKYICFVALLVLASCSNPSDSTHTGDVIMDTQREPVTYSLVTSFYPLAYMTQEIVGENMDVINLTGSADVHEYELSPQDIVMLNETDGIIYQGAMLEPWAEDLIPALSEKGIRTVSVSDMLIEMGSIDKQEEHHDEDEEHHDEDEEHHDEDEEHHDEDEEHHDDHYHGYYDPHTWLDPILAQDMILVILETLITIDPTNEEVYVQRANDLADRFGDLDIAFNQRLDACGLDSFIVSHNAYGYLEDRYGFETHAIGGISTSDEPSAKLLAQLRDESQQEGMTHILVEDNNIGRFADTLAQETGLIALPINPLGRGTLDPQKDFLDVMYENLDSIATALQCPNS